jgi:hypothetical protein
MFVICICTTSHSLLLLLLLLLLSKKCGICGAAALSAIACEAKKEFHSLARILLA